QIGLAHRPPCRGPGVDLPGSVGGESGGIVFDDDPLHSVHRGLAGPEVLRVLLEDRLHVSVIALERKGAGADRRLWLYQVAVPLDNFGSHDPHAEGVGQLVGKPDVRLAEDELHGVAIYRVDPVDRVQQVPLRVPLDREETGVRELHVFGRELATVDGRLVVPSHAFGQMEDIGRVIRLRPPFRQIGLYGKAARRHTRAHLVTKQLAVDEAQGGHRHEVARQVRVEVRWIPATYA